MNLIAGLKNQTPRTRYSIWSRRRYFSSRNLSRILETHIDRSLSTQLQNHRLSLVPVQKNQESIWHETGNHHQFTPDFFSLAKKVTIAT